MENNNAEHHTYVLVFSLRPIVWKSTGHRMTLRYVGNCFVFTGVKNGHASECSRNSDKIALLHNAHYAAAINAIKRLEHEIIGDGVSLPATE